MAARYLCSSSTRRDSRVLDRQMSMTIVSLRSQSLSAPPWYTTSLKLSKNQLDSVTGAALPLCNCCEPKHFNKDVHECELNKFDAMMSHLVRVTDGFEQVVAVDERFDLFSRAWCVAELVEAESSGIPQTIQIHSIDAVDNHYGSLATLDVRDCKASRQEDKHFILQRIQDVESFNSRMQWLIFGEEGLLKDCVDALERSRIFGKVVHRALRRSLDNLVRSATKHEADLEMALDGDSSSSSESVNSDSSLV